MADHNSAVVEQSGSSHNFAKFLSHRIHGCQILDAFFKLTHLKYLDSNIVAVLQLVEGYRFRESFSTV